MTGLKRWLLVTLAAAQLPLLAGCDWLNPEIASEAERKEAQERALAQRRQKACASQATYDRLKLVVFDEAIRIRNADPVNLDTLASHATVRMEQPVVKTHDEALNVTVCTGRFVLQIPPGAEAAFNGERTLVADIEYAAQAAADGSGLVYQIKGAEPIIYKLAAFDLRHQGQRGDVQVATRAIDDAALPPVLTPDQSEPEAEAEPEPRQSPQARPQPQRPPKPERTPERAPEPRQTPRREVERRAPPPPSPSPSTRERAAVERSGSANPSFNCRHARTRSERMVCGSGRLAALDRRMSSLYYATLEDADGRQRAALRRSRDRFLAYRERCRDETCVAEAYRDRMDEIEDIGRGR